MPNNESMGTEFRARSLRQHDNYYNGYAPLHNETVTVYCLLFAQLAQVFIA